MQEKTDLLIRKIASTFDWLMEYLLTGWVNTDSTVWARANGMMQWLDDLELTDWLWSEDFLT